MSEKGNSLLIGQVLQAEEWVTSPEAEQAYTYLPKGKYPTLSEIDQTDNEDKKLIVKIFDPQSRWKWFIAAVDEEQYGLVFGYVVSGMDPNFSEWGFFDITEIANTHKYRNNPLSIPIERDIHWTPKTWREAKESGELDW